MGKNRSNPLPEPAKTPIQGLKKSFLSQIPPSVNTYTHFEPVTFVVIPERKRVKAGHAVQVITIDLKFVIYKVYKV